MSWVALQEVTEVLAHLLSAEALEGPVNVSAPEPVINREFTRTLGRVLHRPAFIPVPAPALRMAFGEMADHTLLSSARVLPAELVESGYRFRWPGLEGALRAMLTPGQRSSFPE